MIICLEHLEFAGIINSTSRRVSVKKNLTENKSFQRDVQSNFREELQGGIFYAKLTSTASNLWRLYFFF